MLASSKPSARSDVEFPTSRVRVPITGVMMLILLAALGIAGFRAGSEKWFRTLYTLTVGALLLATSAAKGTSARASHFWFGFAFFGWSSLLLGFGTMSGMDINYDQDGEPLVNRFLLTTILLKRVCIATSYYTGIAEIGEYGYSLAIGHLVVSAFLAAVGGLVSVAISTRNANELTPDQPGTRHLRAKSKVYWTIWHLALFAFFILVVSANLPTRERPFFPRISTNSTTDYFDYEGFGSHLEAMGEKSLWKRRREHRGAEVYRFLRLRGSGHPMCIRVEKRGELARITYVVLDGTRPRDPGVVAVSRDRTLTQAEWTELSERLRTSGFWSRGNEIGDPRGLYDTHDLVEGIKEGEYRVVSRQTQGNHEFCDVWNFLFGLTGMRAEL